VGSSRSRLILVIYLLYSALGTTDVLSCCAASHASATRSVGLVLLSTNFIRRLTVFLSAAISSRDLSSKEAMMCSVREGDLSQVCLKISHAKFFGQYPVRRPFLSDKPSLLNLRRISADIMK
jgi:hypothetical protein